MKAMCPTCEGRGDVVTPVAAGRVSPDTGQVVVVRTLPQVMPCKTCRGEGWLDGLKPPV